MRPGVCTACQRPGKLQALGMCSKCYQRNLRLRRRIKVKTCGTCGSRFEALRKDALFCSANCRKKAHVLRKRGGSEQVAANLAEIARGQRDTGPQNPPRPYSEMSFDELNRFTLEELQALKREELAALNDARNSAPRGLNVSPAPEMTRRYQSLFTDPREIGRDLVRRVREGQAKEEQRRARMSLIQRSYAKIRGAF